MCVGDVVSTYDSLDAAQRAEFFRLTNHAGEDGLKLVARLDSRTARQMFDVGADCRAVSSAGQTAGCGPAGAWYEAIADSGADTDAVQRHVGIVNRQLDGELERNAMTLVADSRSGGIKAVNGLYDHNGQDALETFFRFGGSDPNDLSPSVARGVRARLAYSYSKDRISTQAMVDSAEAIDDLDTNGQVTDVEEVIKGIDGAKLNERAWVTEIRGSLYEVDSNKEYVVPELDQGDELALDFEPKKSGDLGDNKFTDLKDDQEFIGEMSDELGEDEGQIKDWLENAETGGPEFDSVQFKQNGKVKYYEMKSGAVESQNIKKKIVYFKAYAELAEGVDPADIEFILVYRNTGEVPSIVDSLEWARDKHVPQDYQSNTRSTSLKIVDQHTT